MDEVESLVRLWLRTLRARNLSPATISTYRASAEQLAAHLHEAGVTEVAAISRRHVEEFMLTWSTPGRPVPRQCGSGRYSSGSPGWSLRRR